jgi:hypothetical protein
MRAARGQHNNQDQGSGYLRSCMFHRQIGFSQG